MWNYEKRLQYPVKITQTNPKIAQVIISQFGGPDGELAASMRYLSQRYTMPYKEVTGLLTDIGTEELAHMEMICAIVYQLTKDLTPEEIEKYGFDKYYVDHTLGLWPQAAAGTPWTATYFQSKGDPITDLNEDLAAEQKARTTYDNILRLVKDPEVCDPIRFLREREIVHYQRFGEGLRMAQEKLDQKNIYAVNRDKAVNGQRRLVKKILGAAQISISFFTHSANEIQVSHGFNLVFFKRSQNLQNNGQSSSIIADAGGVIDAVFLTYLHISTSWENRILMRCKNQQRPVAASFSHGYDIALRIH